ncbi:MAG: hypothetical protein ACRENG_03630 [bacterium]
MVIKVSRVFAPASACEPKLTLRAKWRGGVDEVLHFLMIWKFLAQIFDQPQQVRVAILNDANDFVVSAITIDNQSAQQGLFAQHFSHDTG